MIIGMGFDLLEIARIERSMKDEDSLFLSRLLTDKEAEQLSQYREQRRRAEWVAGRFAAKEALFKAIGTGLGGSPGMQDVEILAHQSGRPILTVSPAVERLFDRYISYHVSITHTATTAGAVVIIETSDDRKDHDDD